MVVKSCKFLKIFSHQQDNVHKKPQILEEFRAHIQVSEVVSCRKVYSVRIVSLSAKVKTPSM